MPHWHSKHPFRSEPWQRDSTGYVRGTVCMICGYDAPAYYFPNCKPVCFDCYGTRTPRRRVLAPLHTPQPDTPRRDSWQWLSRLSRLPQQQRDALEWKWLGFSLGETAKHMGISRPSVVALLKRAEKRGR